MSDYQANIDLHQRTTLKQCVACHGAAESYFDNGYACKVCGRRKSLFLSDLQTSEQHQAAEIARLRRIEDAAVACAEDGQWGGETFYELMCELQKTLRGDQDHV